MNKVYCINCKYFSERAYGYSERCFNYTNCKVTEGKYIDTYKERILSAAIIVFKFKPEIINKNNNCKHYKRKWWKFWVK